MKAGWPVKPVGELCEIVGGGTPSKSNAAFFGGDIPWATVRDMKADWIEATEHSITPEAVKNSSTHILPSGTVVIASRVGLGKICRMRQSTAINQDLRGFIPKAKAPLEPQYLFWWFKSAAGQIVAAGNGATVQGVTLPFLRSLKIPLPPLDEQRRIVAVLDKAFAGITTATANAQKNLTNARALFEAGRERVFSGEEHGWERRPFRDLCTIKHGFAFKSAFFGSEGDNVLLTPGNFYETGGYRDRGPRQKFYTGEIPPDFTLSGGDLLVAMTEQADGLLGSPVIVPTEGTYCL